MAEEPRFFTREQVEGRMRAIAPFWVGLVPMIILALLFFVLPRSQADAAPSDRQARAAALAPALAVESAVVLAWFTILEQAEVPLEAQDIELLRLAAHHDAALARLRWLEASAPAIASALEETRRALAAGDHAAAGRGLLGAPEPGQTGLVDADRATLTAAQAAVWLARRDPHRSARLFAEAAASLGRAEAPEAERLRAVFMRGQARALIEQGRLDQDATPLDQAAALLAPLAEATDRFRDPDAWVATQEALGDAYRTRGGLAWDTHETLARAATAYEDALGRDDLGMVQRGWRALVTTMVKAKAGGDGGAEVPQDLVGPPSLRARAPLVWGRIQHKLGLTFDALHSRRFFREEYSEKANRAFRRALMERTRERVPLAWAETQRAFGMATRDELALPFLGDGYPATAFRAALEEQTRERLPFLWADTQHNLAEALAEAATTRRDPDLWDQAVTAYRSALDVRALDRVPAQWVHTRSHLALAMQRWGAKIQDAVVLREAVVGFEAVLAALSRADVPHTWAMNQDRLAASLLDLGILTRDAAVLDQATESYRWALDDPAWCHGAWQCGWTRNGLATALRHLGVLQRDPARLRAAIRMHQEVANLVGNLSNPVLWWQARDDVKEARAALSALDAAGAD